MNKEFDVVLWGIGKSVVFTVPSDIVREFSLDTNPRLMFASISGTGCEFSILMKPWKCGGSMVMTIPVPYVCTFDLGCYVDSKERINVNLNDKQ